jgi:hypothetical protein
MKERLNSDGQTSPAIPTKGKATFHFKEFDTKRPRHMTLDILVLVEPRHMTLDILVHVLIRFIQSS